MRTEHLCKFVSVDNLNEITFGVIRKTIETRAKEISKEATKGLKPCVDIDKWVLRAEPNGSISILAPCTIP